MDPCETQGGAQQKHDGIHEKMDAEAPTTDGVARARAQARKTSGRTKHAKWPAERHPALPIESHAALPTAESHPASA